MLIHWQTTVQNRLLITGTPKTLVQPPVNDKTVQSAPVKGNCLLTQPTPLVSSCKVLPSTDPSMLLSAPLAGSPSSSPYHLLEHYQTSPVSSSVPRAKCPMIFRESSEGRVRVEKPLSLGQPVSISGSVAVELHATLRCGWLGNGTSAKREKTRGWCGGHSRCCVTWSSFSPLCLAMHDEEQRRRVCIYLGLGIGGKRRVARREPLWKCLPPNHTILLPPLSQSLRSLKPGASKADLFIFCSTLSSLLICCFLKQNVSLFFFFLFLN